MLDTKNATVIKSLAEKSSKNIIDPTLYSFYDVKRGLRDQKGAGVLCGLTEVSEVNGTKNVNGVKTEVEGELFYRGVNVCDIVNNCVKDNRFGFEETVYLLLFGTLPSESQLKSFNELLVKLRELPRTFVRDVIMKSPSADMMNMLARCVLNLYSYDKNPDDLSQENVLRQSLQLIAQFPLLAVYSHRAWKYYNAESSLVIHRPVKEYSCAQNLLHILRKNNNFTDLEAKTLDICLIIHAEHGGGNNSSFTTHVVTSSGTDTYSSVAASLGSLKGHKHGGANLKVAQMFDNIKANLPNRKKDALKDYLYKILKKEAFDKSGLIYGMGHAVYTKSDPRCQLLKGFAEKLSVEKGMEKEFELYNNVAEISAQLIPEIHNNQKSVSPNVDFYSGLVYTMLKLPKDLYTPMFAISRIAGWSAHRLEELANGNKIIRPAYFCVKEQQPYVALSERE